MLSDRAERRLNLSHCNGLRPLDPFLAPFRRPSEIYDPNWTEVINWSAGWPFDVSQWTLERGFERNEEEQYYTGGAASNFEITSSGFNLIAAASASPKCRLSQRCSRLASSAC